MQPSLNPHRVPSRTGEGWYYEDRRGIEVYADSGRGVITVTRIPWGKLMGSARRCGKRLADAEKPVRRTP